MVNRGVASGLVNRGLAREATQCSVRSVDYSTRMFRILRLSLTEADSKVPSSPS